MRFSELDTVALARDVPEHSLKAGDVGTIVHCYKGDEAFEVEFGGADARTIAVLTLGADDLRRLKEDEILHARRLPAGRA